MTNLTIGALSAGTGVKVPTIRYYEEIGLLPPPPRTESNRRLYDQTAVRRLGFIRHARALGFEIESIRQLLALADDQNRPCQEADLLARAHLADIESRIARLQSLQAELRQMIDRCAQGQVRTCRVIEVLTDHALCLHDHH